jgi:hypothetical protein
MDDTISYLANHGVLSATDNSTSHIVGAKYGMLWIDVEGTQVRFLSVPLAPLRLLKAVFLSCFPLSTVLVLQPGQQRELYRRDGQRGCQEGCQHRYVTYFLLLCV